MSLILLMTALSGYGRTTQDTGTVLTRFLAPDVPITDRVSVILGADLPRVIFIKPFIVTMSDEHW